MSNFVGTVTKFVEIRRIEIRIRTLVSGMNVPFAGVFGVNIMDFHFLTLSRHTVIMNRKDSAKWRKVKWN